MKIWITHQKKWNNTSAANGSNFVAFSRQFDLEIDGLGSSFDATALLGLGIKRSTMSLEDKDFYPQYFEPYQTGIKMPREGEEAEEYI